MSITQTVPARNAQAIIPGDTGNGPDNGEVEFCRGVYIGGDGNLTVILEDDVLPTTFVGVVAGSLLPIRVSRVMSTNTTATNIVVVW